MKICSFGVVTDHHMLTVFDPKVVGYDLCNEVTDAFLLQGFSWRKGNVGFSTLDDLLMKVEVFLDKVVQLSEDAIYAIRVPFTVESPQGVGVYTAGRVEDVLGIISDDPPHDGNMGSYLPIPPGDYALVFEQGFMPGFDRTGYHGDDEGNAGHTQWGRLWFNLKAHVQPEILRPGLKDLKLCPRYLKPPFPLRMDAKPL